MRYLSWIYFAHKKLWRILFLLILSCLGLMFVNFLLNISLRLTHNRSLPVDGILVLGGSINREIYVAQLAKQQPDIPILVSHGSDAPCIWLIFQRARAPMTQVWLERCAESTFENFFYSVPILQRWKVHKIKLITSATHLPRAKLLANILLSSAGIAFELDIAPETGIPGNKESRLKTGLDVTRSLLWALLARAIRPSCSEVNRLVDIDLEAWQRKGFACERQAELNFDHL